MAPDFLNLSPKDKAIIHAFSMGMSRKEVCEGLGISVSQLQMILSRLLRRYECRDTLQLVVRYMHEYLGVGDPYPVCPWNEFTQIQKAVAVGVGK